MVEAGLLAKTGMNAAGLGLATNALVTDADVGAPGLPYHVLLRAVLDCETVTDALAVLQAGVRSSSANYLVAHAGGSALDIEAAPGDFTRLYPLLPEHGVLLHTNHFLSPALHPVDLSLWAMPSSAVRLQRLRAGVPAHLAHPARPSRTWTASARCWPTTPTIPTASAPTLTRTSIRSSRAPPSPRS